jgi:hypothetical protein
MNDLVKKDETIVDTSTGLLAIIEKMALNPEVDPDKLEKFLDQQERIFKHHAEIAYNEAMVACQQEIPPVQKDAKNSQTNSDYARLETMQRTAMPIISRHGFSLSYGTDNAPSEMEKRITCKVSHVKGHSEQKFIDIPIDDTGMKGAPTKTKTHGAASAISYGQRILLKLIFNIQVGGFDDDGNAAGSGDYLSEEQQANIKALIEETASDEHKFLNYMNVDSIANIRTSQYNKAVSLLEKKRK